MNCATLDKWQGWGASAARGPEAAVALYLCYRMYPYNSAVRRPNGAPLPLEAPYPIHQPQGPQNKSRCLEVNCQYQNFA